MEDAELKAAMDSLTPEKRAIYARWCNAQDALRNARDADHATRAAWAKLFLALDRRAEMRSALEAAQHECQAAAEALKLRTLPLISAALTQPRAESEAETHEAVKRAREEFIEAEIALNAASSKQPESAQ